MNNINIKEFVIHELVKHRNPDDIIKDVCERTGMRWDNARIYVQQVYKENRKEITKKQSGLLGTLAILEIIGGIVISTGMIVATLSGWVILLLRFPIPYLGNITYFSVGVFMILGGIKGLGFMDS